MNAIRTNDDIKNAAVYARVSTLEEQSLEQQVHICRDLIERESQKTNQHYNIINYIEEAGTSGKNTKDRPVFLSMNRDIQSGKLKLVVTKEVSRVARSSADFYRFLEIAEKAKIKLILPGMEIDFTKNDPTSKFLLNMLSLFAELERELIISRTKLSIQSLALNESRIHGQPVILGFKRHPEKIGVWETIDSEIETVRYLFDLFIKYQSISIVIAKVKELGITNKNQKSFTPTSLRRILTNRKYLGKLKVPHQDIEVDLNFPPQIDIVTFNKVQQLLENSNSKKRNRNIKHTYILSGLLFSNKGNPYTGVSSYNRHGTNYTYYRCKQEKTSLSCEEVEKELIKVLKNLCTKVRLDDYLCDISTNNLTKESELKKSISRIKHKIEEQTKTKRTLIDNTFSTLLSPTIINELESRIKQIDIEQKELSSTLSSLNDELNSINRNINSNLVTNIDKKINELFNDKLALKAFLKNIFKKIIINIDTKKISLIWSDEYERSGLIIPYKANAYISVASPKPIQSKNDSHEISNLLTESNYSISKISKHLGISKDIVRKTAKTLNLDDKRSNLNQNKKIAQSFGKKINSRGKIIAHKNEQQVISSIICFRDMKKTYQEIADILNIQQIKTKNGKTWCRKGVYQVYKRNKV